MSSAKGSETSGDVPPEPIDTAGEPVDEDLEQDDIAQVVSALPPEQRTLVRTMIASFQVTGRSAPESAIARQFRPEHIQTYLNGAQESMRREYRDKQGNRILIAFVLTAILAALGFVIVQLKNTPDVMEKIIFAIGGVTTGALGGYGFGRGKKNE
jgi:hypothetical protein